MVREGTDLENGSSTQKCCHKYCCQKFVSRTGHRFHVDYVPSQYRYSAEQRSFAIMYLILDMYEDYVN